MKLPKQNNQISIMEVLESAATFVQMSDMLKTNCPAHGSALVKLRRSDVRHIARMMEMAGSIMDILVLEIEEARNL